MVCYQYSGRVTMIKIFYLICQTYLFCAKKMWKKKVLQQQTKDLQPLAEGGKAENKCIPSNFLNHTKSFEAQQILNKPPIVNFKKLLMYHTM